ncbi:MAG: hypothetical protein ACSLFK_04390, partial [Gemmatimonadaceae bacterium]
MRRLPAFLLAVAATASPLLAQHVHGPEEGKLGAVTFSTSCSPAVQPSINRAVAMLHSFWFEAAQHEFESVAAGDSTCAIAWWGSAMTAWGNPFVRQPIPPHLQAIGIAAAEKALKLVANASHREQMYVDAAVALWHDADKLDHIARMAKHEAAMKALYDAHPEDPEAAVFYARARIATASPADLQFRNQIEAAALLEPMFASQPDHPGLAHYIIHTFDSPKLAKHGLEAARRYAEIAPAAPHALHMPSHIFTRLGYWDESIVTNRKSAAAEPDSNAAVHPNDYMVYAYLQQGRDAEALAVSGRSKAASDRFYGAILGYNAAAMQVRHSLENSRWSEAAALPVPAKSAPFIEAVARFARAIGAARSGNATQAEGDVAALGALRDTLNSRSDSYWATIVDAQRLAASAWVSHARGNSAEAASLARQAADLEETVEKHPVTPGPLLPARELEGDLLLELGRADDALAAYEMTLTREPRRARAL